MKAKGGKFDINILNVLHFVSHLDITHVCMYLHTETHIYKYTFNIKRL